MNDQLRKIPVIKILFKSICNKNNKYLIWILLISFFFVYLYIHLNRRLASYNSSTFFSDIIEPCITILTFLTALVIGFIGLRSEWVNSLEKRLTVTFLFAPTESMLNDAKEKSVQEFKAELEQEEAKMNDLKKDNEIKTDDKNIINTEIKIKKLQHCIFLNQQNFELNKIYIIAVCFEALLCGENDIRAWSQSLGAQIFKSRLSFYAFQNIGQQKIYFRNSGKNKKHILHHMHSIYLSEIPQMILKQNTGLGVDENYDETPWGVSYRFSIKQNNKIQFDEYEALRKFINDNKIKDN